MARKNEYDTRKWQLQRPPNPTNEECIQAAQSLDAGLPLPPGWSIVSYDGRIEGWRTGRVTRDGKHHFIAVRSDDLATKLETATLKVDGVVVFTATRANGAIVDTPDGPVATLSGFTPIVPNTTIELGWTNAAGVACSETVTLQ
ncbi:MAG: hypothetical protein L0323_23275 [Planctomycetes bacterium]|nr:hypothetical protein [Planctomycetota bacterium]